MAAALKVLNSVHLPTWLAAFVLFMVGQFVVIQNGTPLDLSTKEGWTNLLVGLFMAAVAFLQKATPATLKS
jgi:hypothetical protein